MRPANQIEPVFVKKLGEHILAKRKADAPVRLGPAGHLGVGVGPQQVAKQPCAARAMSVPASRAR